MNVPEGLIFVILIIVGCTVGIVAIGLISGSKQQRGVEEHPKEPTPKTRNVTATVIDQYCAVKTVGYQTPKTYTIFTVVFQTDSNEIIKLDVPQEMYDGIEKGQTGCLSLVDGELYSFSLEEDPA